MLFVNYAFNKKKNPEYIRGLRHSTVKKWANRDFFFWRKPDSTCMKKRLIITGHQQKTQAKSTWGFLSAQWEWLIKKSRSNKIWRACRERRTSLWMELQTHTATMGSGIVFKMCAHTPRPQLSHSGNLCTGSEASVVADEGRKQPTPPFQLLTEQSAPSLCEKPIFNHNPTFSPIMSKYAVRAARVYLAPPCQSQNLLAASLSHLQKFTFTQYKLTEHLQLCCITHRDGRIHFRVLQGTLLSV